MRLHRITTQKFPENSLMRLHDFTSQNGPMTNRIYMLPMILHGINSQSFPFEYRYTSMSLHDFTSQSDPWNVGIYLRDYMITSQNGSRGSFIKLGGITS
jgi:hypothetical protein